MPSTARSTDSAAVPLVAPAATIRRTPTTMPASCTRLPAATGSLAQKRGRGGVAAGPRAPSAAVISPLLLPRRPRASARVLAHLAAVHEDAGDLRAEPRHHQRARLLDDDLVALLLPDGEPVPLRRAQREQAEVADHPPPVDADPDRAPELVEEEVNPVALALAHLELELQPPQQRLLQRGTWVRGRDPPLSIPVVATIWRVVNGRGLWLWLRRRLGHGASHCRSSSLRRMTHRFETLAIHAGQEPEPVTGAVVPPIFATSTYQQDAVGAPREGYEYSRTANPTRRALEECLAALEGGRRGLAFASGMAAEDTLLRTVCGPGDHVVIPDDAYGGTYRLFARVAERWGLRWTEAPLHDLDAVASAFTTRTKLLWVETPTNPLLRIADIAALAA